MNSSLFYLIFFSGFLSCSGIQTINQRAGFCLPKVPSTSYKIYSHTNVQGEPQWVASIDY